MGSYLSCASASACSSASVMSSSNTVKVVLSDGRLQEFQRQVKVAEVMLENPQHFLCHASALHVGRRISALRADEDLEMGQLYLLLPMSKLQSVLSVSDVVAITVKAESAKRRGSAKNSPKFAGVQSPEVENSQCGGVFLEREGNCLPKMDMERMSVEELARYRLSRCRSWKPKLETIREVERVRG